MGGDKTKIFQLFFWGQASLCVFYFRHPRSINCLAYPHFVPLFSLSVYHPTFFTSLPLDNNLPFLSLWACQRLVSIPLLHVLLEGGGGGDGLPGILVLLGLGVAGVGHASGSLLRLLTVEGESTGESLRGVKERGVKQRGVMG